MPAEPTPLRSEKTHFHMIPDWLPKVVSPRAYMLFGIMHGYSNKQTGLTFPSRSTLATDMRCTLPTVDATIKELLAAGAMTRAESTRKNGSQTTNRYVLQFDQPTSPAPDEAPSPVKQALPESTLEDKPVLLHPSSQLSPTRKVALAPITRSSELDPVNKNDSSATKRAATKDEPKETPLVPAKKIVATKEWAESIRSEWEHRIDFDEELRYISTRADTKKSLDQRGHIIAFFERKAKLAIKNRDASFIGTGSTIPKKRIYTSRPDDPNNAANW